MRWGSIFAVLVSLALASPAFAASGKEPAPAGSLENAPPQYTRFSARELTRGFLKLAFGSDLRIGAKGRGIRKFRRPIRAVVIPGGSTDRSYALRGVLEDYERAVQTLQLSLAQSGPAEVEVRLIDEKDFNAALMQAFGQKVANTFIARTDPQCMTSVKSEPTGEIVHSVTFVIVDKGEQVFRDCAYHELLHAFGLSNHDQSNRWTTLNQNRMVGYLTVYDRDLLTILYDRRIEPGMSKKRVRARLPEIIDDLGLAQR
jgi:Protein of unknown function (DUF2927)